MIYDMARLEELDTHWSLDDLIRGNQALDLKEQIEIEAARIQSEGK